MRKGGGSLVRPLAGPAAAAARAARPGPAPPRAGAYRRRSNLPNTAFRRFYERGDLPIAMEHRGMKNVIRWKARRPPATRQHARWTHARWTHACTLGGQSCDCQRTRGTAVLCH